MSETMMLFGPYRFALDRAAYQTLERSSSYRWARQERIGSNDQLQYTGPGPETISLTGVVYPHFAGGLGQIDRMRVTAALGVPLPLISGSGKVLGFWCVEQIAEGQTYFERGGAPLRQEFTMDLVRYDGGLGAILRF
jgi:phage protein U